MWSNKVFEVFEDHRLDLEDVAHLAGVGYPAVSLLHPERKLCPIEVTLRDVSVIAWSAP